MSLLLLSTNTCNRLYQSTDARRQAFRTNNLLRIRARQFQVVIIREVEVARGVAQAKPHFPLVCLEP